MMGYLVSILFTSFRLLLDAVSAILESVLKHKIANGNVRVQALMYGV